MRARNDTEKRLFELAREEADCLEIIAKSAEQERKARNAANAAREDLKQIAERRGALLGELAKADTEPPPSLETA